MGRSPWMQRLMLAYYRPIVAKEVSLSRASAQDQILCVGGGYFPCTAILFHQLSGGATVTVIDNDREAVDVAQKLVERLGLADRVLVRHTDGLAMCAQHYDIIHIAMQISPKEAVFRQVHSTARPSAKILVRNPKAHLERGYQPFQTACKQYAFTRQPSFSNIATTGLYVR